MMEKMKKEKLLKKNKMERSYGLKIFYSTNQQKGPDDHELIPICFVIFLCSLLFFFSLLIGETACESA